MRFKKWLIRWLGGIVLSDLPMNLQLSIMDHWGKATLDKQTSDILKAGF